MKKFYVTSYHVAEQQWYADIVVASEHWQATELVCEARPYVSDAKAVSFDNMLEFMAERNARIRGLLELESKVGVWLDKFESTMTPMSENAECGELSYSEVDPVAADLREELHHIVYGIVNAQQAAGA